MPAGYDTGPTRKRMRTRARGRPRRARLVRTRRARVTRTGYAKAKAQPYRQIARNNYRAKMNTTLAMKGYALAKRAWLRSYGPQQIQLQRLHRVLIPTTNAPICFDMNDVAGYDGDGKRCMIYQMANYGQPTQAIGVASFFQPINLPGPDTYDMWLENENYAVNADEHYAAYAVYDITIDAKVDDVTLRFDFLKCKTDYRYYQDFRQFLLPDCLPGMTALAENPPQNRINPKYFRRTRKPITMYLNARGTVVPGFPVATPEFETEVPATTGFRRNIRIYHRINKVIKQTRAPGVNNVNSTDPTVQNAPDAYSNVGGDTAAPPYGSYSDPWHRKISDSEWCLISCNDATANPPVVGDRVVINVTRKVMWRDRVA